MKRKLNSDQIKRLKEIKVQRLARRKNSIDNESNLGPEQKGILITHNSTMVIVQSPEGKLTSCTLRQNLGSLVTGDNVIWQAVDEHTGVVIACEPRRSVIVRPDSHGTKPIVANVDLMVIVVALAPMPQITTIDRYLILAHMMNLKALIVVNKFDLFLDDTHAELLDRMKVYQGLGYGVLRLSTETKLGLHELRETLKDINSILVGQSGVGAGESASAAGPGAAVGERAAQSWVVVGGGGAARGGEMGAGECESGDRGGARVPG